jgi:hypothetical protein
MCGFRYIQRIVLHQCKLNVLAFGVEGGRSGVQGCVICRLWTKAMFHLVRAIGQQLEEAPELFQFLQGGIGSDASSTGYKYDNCDLGPLMSTPTTVQAGAPAGSQVRRYCVPRNTQAREAIRCLSRLYRDTSLLELRLPEAESIFVSNSHTAVPSVLR